MDVAHRAEEPADSLARRVLVHEVVGVIAVHVGVVDAVAANILAGDLGAEVHVDENLIANAKAPHVVSIGFSLSGSLDGVGYQLS